MHPRSTSVQFFVEGVFYLFGYSKLHKGQHSSRIVALVLKVDSLPKIIMIGPLSRFNVIFDGTIYLFGQLIPNPTATTIPSISTGLSHIKSTGKQSQLNPTPFTIHLWIGNNCIYVNYGSTIIPSAYSYKNSLSDR